MIKYKREILKLQILVFVAGFVLMAIEIVGGRLLTPYYGGSVYIWGSVIGLFLVGLSMGYYIGGYIADKRPDNKILSVIIFAAAVFILIIPLIYLKVISLFSGIPVSIAPLATCCSLFLMPSILLGIISPFAIKMSVKDIGNIGNISGKLSAISALGSVIGTFLTTFVLISFFPLKIIFFFFGIILIICAMMFTRKKITLILLILVLSISTLAVLFFGVKSDKNISGYISSSLTEKSLKNLPRNIPSIITEESLYGQVIIGSNSRVRYLVLNGGVMGVVDINNKTKILPGWEYISCFKNAFIVNKDIKNVLMIGLGAGLLSSQIRDAYPNVNIDAVDINPTVIDFAKKYFGVKEDNKLKLIESDGRVFIDKTEKKYDLIVVDAYKFKEVYKIPQQLATQEFFESAKKHLNEGGILSLMYVGRRDIFETGRFHKSEYKTLKSVFNNVYFFDCYEQIVFASESPLNISKIKDTPVGKYYEPNEKKMDLSKVEILTDEYYPVNIAETTNE